MRNEADLKRIFKNSIVKQRGYCISLATGAISGVPDLYCLLPNRIPIMVEAKFFPKPMPTNFKRKIPYQLNQVRFLSKLNEVCRGSAWGLVGLKWLGEIYGVLIDPAETHVSNDGPGLWLRYDPTTKLFEDITSYHKLNIPILNRYVVETPAPIPVPLSIPI